jgi:hypothetical protein
VNGSYELKSFATDDPRRNVLAYAVFHGTHCGYRGPCHSTENTTLSNDGYIMEFDGRKMRHVTKIWHLGLGLKKTRLGIAADRFSALPTIISGH